MKINNGWNNQALIMILSNDDYKHKHPSLFFDQSYEFHDKKSHAHITRIQASIL